MGDPMNETSSTLNRAAAQKWHLLTLLPESTPDQLLARAEAGPGSPWYSGHFPGEPILPGIAQIAMVKETIEQGQDRTVCITGLKRVRFKLVIQPGDEITVRVSPREHGDDDYSFQVMVNAEIACSGIVSVAAAVDG